MPPVISAIRSVMLIFHLAILERVLTSTFPVFAIPLRVRIRPQISPLVVIMISSKLFGPPSLGQSGDHGYRRTAIERGKELSGRDGRLCFGRDYDAASMVLFLPELFVLTW